MMSPGAVVQAQLDAFNARDLDALLATYAPDAQQYVLHGALLAQGWPGKEAAAGTERGWTRSAPRRS